MPDSARRRKCLLRERERAGKRDPSGEKANQVETKVTPCPVHTQYGHRLYSFKGGGNDIPRLEDDAHNYTDNVKTIAKANVFGNNARNNHETR